MGKVVFSDKRRTSVASFWPRTSLGCSITCCVASDAASDIASDDVSLDVALNAVFRFFVAGWLLSSSAGSSLVPRCVQTSSADLIFASRFWKRGAIELPKLSMCCASLSTEMTMANAHRRGEIPCLSSDSLSSDSMDLRNFFRVASCFATSNQCKWEAAIVLAV